MPLDIVIVLLVVSFVLGGAFVLLVLGVARSTAIQFFLSNRYFRVTQKFSMKEKMHSHE